MIYDLEHITGRVAQAYQYLKTESKILDRAQPVSFLDAPTRLMDDPTFIHRRRHFAAQLRIFFCGDDGHRAAIILGLARHVMVVGKRDDDSGHTEYGIGSIGPYKNLIPKKLPFRRQKKPEVTRISIEELCYFSTESKWTYEAVCRLLDTTVDDLLGKKK